jgi:hypothetical protein
MLASASPAWRNRPIDNGMIRSDVEVGIRHLVALSERQSHASVGYRPFSAATNLLLELEAANSISSTFGNVPNIAPSAIRSRLAGLLDELAEGEDAKSGYARALRLKVATIYPVAAMAQ